MKKIFFYFSLGTLALVSSCRKMDDNISPNMVDPASISPRQLLAAAENSVYSTQVGSLNILSNVWTNTWAGNIYYYGNPLTREYSLDISNTFQNGIWNSGYITAGHLQNIINNGSSLPLHSAIARILKANTMQYIVDFYGDAPYSEAFKKADNLSPRYDDDAMIYKDLVMELNKAIADIDATVVNGENKVNAEEDVIFKGNMSNWKMFAKNVKLRILLRQSNVTDPGIRSFVDAQLQTLATSNPGDFFTGNVVINPGYSSSNAATLNPVYAQHGMIDASGTALNSGGWRLYKLSEYFANSMNGTLYGVGDLRGTVQFRRLSSNNNPQSFVSIRGIKQGGGKIAGANEWSFSFLGWKFINSNTDVYGVLALGDSNAYKNILNNGASMDGYLALNAENKLMLAEAAVLYPSIFTYSPLSLYQAAVQDSFAFYGLTSAQATAYLASLDTKSVGWNGAPSKIAAIQYQRLTSLANLRQVETYINYLKTGYPSIPVADNANYPNKPYRLIYPISEYSGNSTNVPNVSQAQCFTKNSFTPFWNQ